MGFGAFARLFFFSFLFRLLLHVSLFVAGLQDTKGIRKIVFCFPVLEKVVGVFLRACFWRGELVDMF